MDIVAPGLKATREIIDHWNPFNKRESSVACMCDIYPALLRVPVVRKSFQRVAEDGMLICNHDFKESAELVCFGF